MERKITRIDALPQFDKSLSKVTTLRRVAAYVRVSTDKDEQQNSYENQLDYYPKLIAARLNWQYMGMYSDEGLSATSTAKRDGFNRLIEEALAGKFDLIVTKSISRFARNTVDTLTTVRMLKSAGVEVWFEREDLFSFDGKGEFMLTLLSSLAQEESRSISENTTWGIRKKMADGIYSMPYARFLGYKKGADGKPAVVKEEAAIVRRIFRMFLQRYSIGSIAKILTAEGIPSPAGKPRWLTQTVFSILRNEKYSGNARLQKGYTEDFITKKRVINQGELPQYLVEGGHTPIVSRVVYDETLKRLEALSVLNQTYPSRGFLTNTVFCGNCGEKFGRRIVGNYNRPNKYKHIVWRCAQTYGKQRNCRVPHLYEEVAAFLFQRAMLELLAERHDTIELCRKLIISTIDKKKRDAVESCLSGFVSRSPLDIPFDGDAWRTLIEKAEVLPERRLRLCFFGGEVREYPIPKFSGIRDNFIVGSVLGESLMTGTMPLQYPAYVLDDSL